MYYIITESNIQTYIHNSEGRPEHLQSVTRKRRQIIVIMTIDILFYSKR